MIAEPTEPTEPTPHIFDKPDIVGYNIDLHGILNNTLDSMDFCGSHKLNNEEVIFISRMLKENPETFHNISSEITNLLNSKELHIGDIPEIIHIISTIFISDFENKDVAIIECIKFTLDVLLESGLLPLNGVGISIIKTIVDSSLNLLKINIKVVESESIRVSSYFINFIASLCCI
jgi:hypothetical protein